jgi:hypothetical protein
MDVLRTSRMQIESIWGQQSEDEGNGILGQDSDGSGLAPWLRRLWPSLRFAISSKLSFRRETLFFEPGQKARVVADIR